MTGYSIVNLSDLLDEMGEEFVKELFKEYDCPLNLDVDYFLKEKAIEFSRQKLSRTHLVFCSFKHEPVLIGYFTLCYKTINLTRASLSKNYRKRISKYARYNEDLKAHIMAAPLIAQIGKNFANGYDSLITGDELLKMACEKVTAIQNEVGGKIVYLECEDKQRLIDFYTQNGFIAFDKRKLDKDEIDHFNTQHLVQMLKVL